MVQWSPQDDAAVRLAKLEAMLEQYDQPLCDSVPLMASLLSLELSETDSLRAVQTANPELRWH